MNKSSRFYFPCCQFPVLSVMGVLILSMGLTGCGTSPKAPDTQISQLKPVIQPPKPSDDADVLYGEIRDDLTTIETMYQRNKVDAMNAARYGKALREAGQLKTAKAILLPISDNKDVGTLVNTELSAIYLSDGDFNRAESFARKAVKQDGANYRAWRNLGNALDAQEKYVEGETVFRRSMDIWTGEDKVPVMNNLALNLAAQGYTDRALTLLYEAKKLSPDRIEIERNIRIIRTLSEPPEFSKGKKPFPETKTPE